MRVFAIESEVLRIMAQSYEMTCDLSSNRQAANYLCVKLRFAKALYPLKGTQGSNPCLTAGLLLEAP